MVVSLSQDTTMNFMTRYEQETIVTYNNEEKTAEIYTCDPIVIRKLDALVEKYPSCYQMIKETEESKTYSCPKKMIAFRKPVVMSDEQKEKASERLRKYRESEQSTTRH